MNVVTETTNVVTPAAKTNENIEEFSVIGALCCGGIENAVKQALLASGEMIPWQVVTISTDGNIVE